MSSIQNLNECYVCMLENNQLEDTCGHPTHKICSMCRNLVDICPMCRVSIPPRALTMERCLADLEFVGYYMSAVKQIQTDVYRAILNLLAITYQVKNARKIVRYFMEHEYEPAVDALIKIIFCFWVRRVDRPDLLESELERVYICTRARILDALELIENRETGLRKKSMQKTYPEIRSQMIRRSDDLFKMDL